MSEGSASTEVTLRGLGRPFFFFFFLFHSFTNPFPPSAVPSAQRTLRGGLPRSQRGLPPKPQSPRRRGWGGTRSGSPGAGACAVFF